MFERKEKEELRLNKKRNELQSSSVINLEEKDNVDFDVGDIDINDDYNDDDYVPEEKRENFSLLLLVEEWMMKCHISIGMYGMG